MRKGLILSIAKGSRSAALVLALGAGAGFAQDFGVNGDGSNNSVILQGKNINAASSDKIGVQGYSVPAGFFGIGVKGVGGYMGLYGYTNAPTQIGTGVRYGVYSYAGNGGSNIAVEGVANGGTGTNYAIYGIASGASSRAGYFNGDLEYTGALIHISDRKFKKNIVDIRNCTNLIRRMAPKEYEYRSDEFPAMNLPKTHQAGLVAQDVEAVLPDLVHESIMPDATPDGEKGAVASQPVTFKGVDYVGLIPYLVGALQEQADEIEGLKKKLGGKK